MSIRITQVGNEVWVINASNIRVTQISNEVWVINGGNIRVTQIGAEVWRTVAGSPLTMEGHADGLARVYAISAPSATTEGHADGYAVVRETKPTVDPLIAFMVI